MMYWMMTSCEPSTSSSPSSTPLAIARLAALLAVQAAMVDGDGQRILVHLPELLHQHLGLGAGVDEDDAGPGGFDLLIDLRHGIARQIAAERHPRRRRQNAQFRPGA